MKICLFDHHNTPYPVKTYGGIERINQNLFTYLVDNGYDVTLLINDNNLYHYKNAKIIQLPFTEIENIRFGRKEIPNIEQFDIFHTHTSGVHQSLNLTNLKGKWVASCNGDKEDAAAPYQVFVSECQYKNHVIDYNCNNKCRYTYLCYNGIDTSLLYPDNSNRTKNVWIGSIRPVKGVHLLPQIAEKIGEQIHLYGVIYPHDQEYFDTQILPHIGNTLTFNGPIRTEEEKRKMFNEAKLYLHPAVYDEPCALTLLEAQACGVPVVGTFRGCLPELVCNKQALGKTVNDMSDIIKTQKYWVSENDLLNWINKRFTIQKMAETYVKIWKHAVNN